MSKKPGFKIRIDGFVVIDKSNFGQQAALYGHMDTLKTKKVIPPELLAMITVTDATGKQGAVEVPDPPSPFSAALGDPAATPLTTDPLPEGAAVIEAAGALDGTVIQTVKLADGTEVLRRVSPEQDEAERKALEAASKTKPKGK